MTADDPEQGTHPSGERHPLLGAQAPPDDGLESEPSKPKERDTTSIWVIFFGVIIIGLLLVFAPPEEIWDDPFPTPGKILKSSPVIDGHIGQFAPRVFDPQHLGLSPFYLRVCV